jgi:uncharacterized protein YjbJ (UPF0337 family)
VGQRSDELRARDTNVQHAPDHPDDGELEAKTADARVDIELTRTEMTSTIEAIQDKLNPEVLSEQAKDTAHDVTDYAIREAKEAAREITEHAITQAREAVRDVTGQAKLVLRDATIGKVENMARSATNTAGGWRQGVMETIKANPMPATLVGLGVGWMLLNRPDGSTSRNARLAMYDGYRNPSYPTGPSVADRAQGGAAHVAGRVQDTAGAALDQVEGTAGEVMAQVQEASGQVVDQVQEQAVRAQSFLHRQLEENPLIVGAVAVAVGGILASTVRSTPREDQLLGTARDRVMQAAQDVAGETVDKVSRVVDQAQSAATEEARKQELVSDTPER